MINNIASNILLAVPTKNAAKPLINIPTGPNLHIPIIPIKISKIPITSTWYPLLVLLSFFCFFFFVT